MFKSVKLNTSRIAIRVALLGLGGMWLTGCSTDATRFSESLNSPFSNPFSTASNDAAPAPSAPNNAYVAPPHQSPVTSTPLPAPAPMATGAIRPPAVANVAPAPEGWSAVGGSPVMVIQGDTGESLAKRYGVPMTALLSANGLSSSSQVHSGMHLIIPVYNARARAASEPQPIPTASEPKRHVLATAANEDADAPVKPKAKAKKTADDDDGDDDAKPAAKDKKAVVAETEPQSKTKAKGKHEEDAAEDAPKSKAEKKSAEAKTEKKTAEAKTEKKPAEAPVVADKKDAKADKKAADIKTAEAKSSPVKPVDGKAANNKTAESKTASGKTADAKTEKTKADKPQDGMKVAQKSDAPSKAPVDPTPTSRVAPSDKSEPETSAQADQNGANPEFRWPARGRIIQGFKSGGNEGINISVPEGTSVRAAENGVVAYAGNELKGYGNLILIRHPNGFVSAYANNGEIDVKRGETVKRGQVIAKSGESGNVSAPQLHFELRDKSGAPVDPTNFLAGL